MSTVTGPTVSERIRVYHPDYEVTWKDRLYDWFSGRQAPPRSEGVDYTLVNRVALRALRELLEGVVAVTPLGQEMMRIDSAWRLPDAESARQAVVDGLVGRLRLAQVLPDGGRRPLAVRWLQFEDVSHGTRILVRLLDRPNPALHTVLAGNMSEDSTAWSEFAVGTD